MAKTTIVAIQAIVAGFIRRELKESKRVTFPEIRAFVNASFPGQTINFMTAVRSPMQQLINEGTMKRDVSNLMEEIYTV